MFLLVAVTSSGALLGVAYWLHRACCKEYAVWIHIDPRKGSLQAYPGHIAQYLEAKHKSSREAQLGDSFHNATVRFTESDGYWQFTKGGKRGVRRMVVRSGATTCCHNVVQVRNVWKFAATEEPSTIMTAQLSRKHLVDVKAVSEAVARGQGFVPNFLPNEEESTRALWQWCREAGSSPASLDDSCWCAYGEEHNTAIEQAFQRLTPQVTITLGLQDYDVTIDPPQGRGWQLDKVNHKRRMIRRKLLDTPEQLQQALRPSPPSHTRDAEECFLCYEPFSQTAARPTVEMPCCQHPIHQVCGQRLVDSNQKCPMCRSNVDWAGLGFITQRLTRRR